MSIKSTTMKPTNPNVCGHPMGVKSFGSIKNLKFCARPKGTCQYHKGR